MESTSPGVSGERRVVTALFCDVVGSTSIAESMDPEDWSEVVAEVVNTMGTVIDRYGGTLFEFGGDAVVAVFGAPTAHEDDPYRAVRAGKDIVGEIGGSGTLGADIEVRVGINTGLVVVGDIEAGPQSIHSALGDTLNVAARLQSLAEPGSVLVSASTRRLLGSDVEVRALGPVTLKGRSAPVEAFAIEAVKDFYERARGLPGLTSPLVGRDDELAALRGLVTLAAAGTCRVAAVLGEPGVGKSRLVDELRHGGEVTLRWIEGSCVPYDEELPYHLVGGLVRSLAGVAASEPPDVVGKAIDDLVETLGLTARGAALRLLVGVGDSDASATGMALREEFSEAFCDVMSAAAKNTPLVVVCEDVHWADPSSVEVMSDLLGRVTALPILLLMVMRSDRQSVGWQLLEAARRRFAFAFSEVQLAALPQETSRALVSNLLEIESLPSHLRRMVLERAEGNPFFLEEMIRMLIESGVVTHRAGRWVATGDVTDLDVPETIHGLLASRIDMLTPDERRAGRIAAVIGRRFPAGLFAEVYSGAPGSEPAGLHPLLGALEAHGMIRVDAVDPELEFVFRHALIHDVMYGGLLKRERRALHGEVADALERRYPDRTEELAPLLGRHHAEAGRSEQAVRHLFVAGRRAMAQGARTEAAGFFGHAQTILEVDPDASATDRIDAVIGRLTAGMGFTPGPESRMWIDSVMPLAVDLDDADRLALLYERSIWTRGMQGESYSDPVYRNELDAAHALVPRLTDDATAALLEAMMGGAHRSGDNYAESVEPLRHAIDRLADLGRATEASYNASMLADSLSVIGRFDEAVEAIDRARELAEASGDANAMLDAELIRGSIAADRGDLEEALEFTRRGIAAADEEGNTFCSLAGNFKLADQQLRLGEVSAAIGHLERSTGLAEYCNAGAYETLGHAWLAAARARSGDLRPEEFDAPLEAAVASSSRSTEGLVRMQRAVAFAGAGRYDEAAEDFETAITLFEDYGGLPNLARAEHAYGESLAAAGRADAAAAHLAAAEKLFTDLGIRPDNRLGG